MNGSALPSRAGWRTAGLLLAAEQAVSQVADAIRSSRPADCDFQEEVLAALKP